MSVDDVNQIVLHQTADVLSYCEFSWFVVMGTEVISLLYTKLYKALIHLQARSQKQSREPEKNFN